MGVYGRGVFCCKQTHRPALHCSLEPGKVCRSIIGIVILCCLISKYKKTLAGYPFYLNFHLPGAVIID